MKKITTMVNIVLSGKDGATVPFNYEASDVFDALKAHRDIEHTIIGNAESSFTKIIIPFHGVDMAMIGRMVEDATAPTDAVCGE